MFPVNLESYDFRQPIYAVYHKDTEVQRWSLCKVYKSQSAAKCFITRRSRGYRSDPVESAVRRSKYIITTFKVDKAYRTVEVPTQVTRVDLTEITQVARI